MLKTNKYLLIVVSSLSFSEIFFLLFSVPLTPRPILNINISGGNISPNGNRSNTTLEQVSKFSPLFPFLQRKKGKKKKGKKEIFFLKFFQGGTNNVTTVENDTYDNQYDDGFIIGLLSFIMLFAGLIGGIYWWKRKYFSKCPVKVKGQRKMENDVRIIFFFIYHYFPETNDKRIDNKTVLPIFEKKK